MRHAGAEPKGSAFFVSESFTHTREALIAQANPATFAKRALEQQKKRKAQEKLARRAARKQAKGGNRTPY